MKIMVIARLKPSQINYKIQPLLNSELVEEIIVLRKYDGPPLKKLKYIVLPKLFKYRVFYVLFTPFFGIYYAKKYKVDLIIGYHFVPHGFNAFFTSLVTKIPYIYAQIDMDIEHYCKNYILKFIVKKIINNAAYVLVPGNHSKQFWVNMGFSENKIRILHSSIDTENQFYPVKKEHLYDLLFIGTIDKNKRILLIIKAVKYLIEKGHNIKFAIAGYGPEEKLLISFILKNNLQDHISFLGKIENVFNIINSSKVFIMASEFEGLPCALLEAMACGKIVLTTPVGGITDAVKEGYTGFLLNEINHIAIAERIKNILQNFGTYSGISSNARDIITKHHSFTSTTLKWNKLLYEMKHENFN
jgi:glycosyltransferase involved in cell wall biosynthesis